MDEAGFRDWVHRYELAWRSPGTAQLAELFTDDAVYRHSPYAEPLTGLPAIAEDWVRERKGPDEPFTLTADVLAVNAEHPSGPLGIARIEVGYGTPGGHDYRDLWIVRFDPSGGGKAREFEEWPFWAGQDWTAGS